VNDQPEPTPVLHNGLVKALAIILYHPWILQAPRHRLTHKDPMEHQGVSAPALRAGSLRRLRGGARSDRINSTSEAYCYWAGSDHLLAKAKGSDPHLFWYWRCKAEENPPKNQVSNPVPQSHVAEELWLCHCLLVQSKPLSGRVNIPRSIAAQPCGLLCSRRLRQVQS